MRYVIILIKLLCMYVCKLGLLFSQTVAAQSFRVQTSCSLLVVN